MLQAQTNDIFSIPVKEVKPTEIFECYGTKENVCWELIPNW